MQDLSDHRMLCTDLNQLTLAAAYHRERMEEQATFSLFVRDYPPYQGCFVLCGLEEVLDFFEAFRFEEAHLDHLESTGLFTDGFLHGHREGAGRELRT